MLWKSDCLQVRCVTLVSVNINCAHKFLSWQTWIPFSYYSFGYYVYMNVCVCVYIYMYVCLYKISIHPPKRINPIQHFSNLLEVLPDFPKATTPSITQPYQSCKVLHLHVFTNSLYFSHPRGCECVPWFVFLYWCMVLSILSCTTKILYCLQNSQASIVCKTQWKPMLLPLTKYLAEGQGSAFGQSP